MQIKDLIRLMWRNVIYLVLGIVLGAGIGIYVSHKQIPVYESTAKVFVGKTSQQPNGDVLLLDDDQLLAITLQLAKFLPPDNVNSQLSNIQFTQIPNTQIISIQVEDKNPQQAATIANSLVQTLIQQNGTLFSQRYTEYENSINDQIDEVQKQIDSFQTQIGQINNGGINEQLVQVNQQIDQLQTKISGLNQEIAKFPDSPSPLQSIQIAEKQAELDQLHSLMALYQEIQTNLSYIGSPDNNGASLANPRLTTLQSTMERYQEIYLTLITDRESARVASAQSSDYIMQIVTAIPADSPLLPVPVPYFLLGGFVGLVLTAIVLVMIDHLNDSLKSVGQIEELLGLPVLEFVSTKKFIRSGLVSAHTPLTSEINALDDLAVQIDLIAMHKNVRTLLVTNIGHEGVKTTIAANLAIMFAQRGKRVVLLDGDLRQPHLQTIFGIENKTGVIGLLNGDIDPTGVIRVVDDNHSFAIIPSGTEPGKLIRWPDADNLTHLFSKLQKQADLIIVDGPTAEKVDTQMLASQVDAVLILIKSDHTHAAACQAALKRFQLAGGSVIGAILFSTHKIRQ